MRSRDLALVLLSVAALIGLWAQEGTLSITNNFYIRMYSVGHHRYLPKPVVSDVDGDGYNEVLAVTQPEKLGLFETHGVGAHVASTLEPAKSFTTYSNIIGVASGYLSFPGNDTAHTAATSGLWFGGNTKKRHAMQGHKQHVAVVTDDYRLTMLTSTLVEVWTATLAESNMANTVPKTAAVVVLPDRVFESDTGVVVVAIAVSGLDGTPQESIAAFDGATGALRWRHFVTTSSSLVLKEAGPNYTASGLNFKLTEMDLAEHVNSLDWTHFRESVISSMPSAYNHPWDNALHPFRFVHTKNRKKQVRNDKLKRPQSERPKENHNLKPLSQKDGGDLGERYASALAGNKHGAKGGARRQHVRPLPNTVVLRTPSGVHFVHLFTGRTITSLVPLKRDVTYDDLDDDLVLDSVETNIGVQQEQFKRHGFSEQFVCEGVIKTNAAASESIIARGGICDSEGYINSLGLLRHLIRGDTAEQAAPHLDPLNRIGSHNVGGSNTLTVPPVVAHLRRPLGRHIFKTQRFAIFMISHGIVTALEPKHGGIVWRAETPSSFELRAKDDTHDASTTNWFHVTTAEERDAQLHHYPHLLMYNFHTLHFDPSDVRNVQAARHRHEPIVVAVGTNHLTLIDSLHGTIAATLAIDHVPVGPSVVADIDGDGVNDLLVTTATGYHGFTIKQHASGTTTAMVLVMGIAIAAMLYVSQHGMDFEIFGNTAGVLDEAEAELDDAPILGRSAAPEGLRRRAGKRSTD